MTDAVPAIVDAAEVDSRFGRDALIVTVCTLFSRMTGLVRVIVAAAVLSTGVLGDTYSAANLVPNLIFELVAGGVVQAVLVPSFVAARRISDDELGRSAGAVVAVLTAVLAAIAAVVMLMSPLIARGLSSLDHDPTVAADKLRVMQPMLLVFIPQIIFYGIGLVATAALAARRRFAAAALAPAVNNLVVITCYLLYRASRAGERASLDLDEWQFALLAGGTTLGVIAFTAVPGIVLRAQGIKWGPRWDLENPAVEALRGSVGWAMLSVVGTLVPTGAAVLFGFGVEGGVAVFMFAFAFFVLPHALIAVPVATAVAPRVADSWQRGNVADTGLLIERSARTIVPLLALAGAGMAALSWPAARLVGSFGQAASQGYAPIAHAMAWFGAGLLGYGMAFLMTRVLFSIGDVQQAAILITVAAAGGVAIMAAATAVMPRADRAAALALGYGATQTISAALLTARARRVTGAPTWSAVGRLTIGSGVAAAVAAAAMLIVQRPFGTARIDEAAAILVAGTVGVLVFVALIGPLAGVDVRALRRRGAVGG
ncbi:MAG: lipid II flippase MurJ [Ilumatobacteraceae bacterium]